MPNIRMIHVPQISTNTGAISCMADDCHWSFPQTGPGAQESFEAHLHGVEAPVMAKFPGTPPENPNYERKLVGWNEK